MATGVDEALAIASPLITTALQLVSQYATAKGEAREAILARLAQTHADLKAELESLPKALADEDAKTDAALDNMGK